MTEKQFEELTNPEIADNDVIQGAYDSLLEGCGAQLADETAPLDEEEGALRQEQADIAEAAGNLENLLPAQQREAQRQADAALLAGRLEEAEAQRQEYETARHAPEAMKARQREITARLEAITDERQAIAKHVFGVWYSDLQRIIRASEHALFVGLLDTSKAEMYRFQDRHGLGATLERPFSGLVTDGSIAGLTAPDRSQEWESGHRWYSGRQR